MSATPGTPRSAASCRPSTPGGGPARVVQDPVEAPIRSLGRCRCVQQQPAVLVVEQHPLAVVAHRDRGQRGRHVQDMLDRAEVEPVPLQLGQGEAAVGILADPAHQRRLRTQPRRRDRRVGRHAAHHGVQAVGDMLARHPRQLGIAEDEVDHGDADAQDPCHCLPVLVAITVAWLTGRGPCQPGPSGGLWPSGTMAARLPQHSVARPCAVAAAK